MLRDVRKSDAIAHQESCPVPLATTFPKFFKSLPLVLSTYTFLETQKMASCWTWKSRALVILTCAVVCVHGWRTHLRAEDVAQHDFERQLHEKLQKNYNSHVLPPHNKTSPVRVAIELSVIAIQELNERTESLTLDAWLKMQWNDSRLIWMRDDYGELATTRLPPHLIWHPDIKLFNRVKLSEIETQADVFCVVRNTGEVEWVVPSTFHSSCSIDLKFYPFDIQTCQLIFGSWNLNGHHIDMDLVQQKDKIQFHHFFNANNQWDVAGSHVRESQKYFPCCKEPFPDVTFEIRLRRRSPYYKQTILYPTFGVAALTLATFWLPPQSKDKIVLGGINFFILVLILTHLSWKLPPASKTIPMILAFCGHLVMIVVSSIILSIIFVIYGRSQYSRPPPRWMRTLVNSMLGRILCVQDSPVIVFSSKNHVEEPNNLDLDLDDIKNGPSELERQQYFTSQWLQVLQMINRINFIIFLVIVAFSLAGSFTFNQ